MQADLAMKKSHHVSPTTVVTLSAESQRFETFISGPWLASHVTQKQWRTPSSLAFESASGPWRVIPLGPPWTSWGPGGAELERLE